jgi:hypothetical protein
MWILVLQRMVLEFLLDIVYFPMWWYTGGAKHAFLFCVGLFKEANSFLAPGLWLKNIFVPMFGQYDWQGRIMSFFMRVVNVIFRAIALIVWSFGICVLFFVWFAFPVFVVYMLVLSLTQLK